MAEQLGDHIWLHYMEMQSLYFKNKIVLFNFNNLLVFRIHMILIILQTKGLAANMTGLNIMYLAVVQLQTLSVTK